MSKGTLLLIGPGLPYHVLDYAIVWAKENEATLRTLFLVPGNLPEEGYPFPSDLDESEDVTSDNDAERGMREIIRNESRFIEKRCTASHVPVSIEVLSSPSAKKVLDKIEDSEVVFLDKKAQANEDDLKILPFSLSDITGKATGQVVTVDEMDKYSDALS